MKRRDLDFLIQCAEQSAQRDAASIRTKNEQEQCYSLEEIERLASGYADTRYMNFGDAADDPEHNALKSVYRLVFRNVARRFDQEVEG